MGAASLPWIYEWGAPLAAVLGALLLLPWFWRELGRGASDPPEGREALEARYRALLDELRELRAERDRHEPADYAELFRERVLEAAGLLRRLDAAGSRCARGRLLPFAGAWLLLGAFLLLLSWVGQERLLAAERGARATAMHRAGTGGMGANPHEAGGDGLPAELEELDALARRALFAGDLQAALQAVERARSLDPDDPGVRVHLDALRLSVGMADRAAADLEQVVAEHGEFPEAWLWLGLARMSLGDVEGSRAAFDRLRELAPDGEEVRFLEATLAAMGGAPAGPP